MIKKSLNLILIGIMLIYVGIHKISAAEYFDNHMDWNTYCMRARNITISYDKLQEILKNGTLSQEMTNDSHIEIKFGNPNVLFENWELYAGALFVDIGQLNTIESTGENITKTIIFYMDKDNLNENYIAVQVIVTPAGFTDSIEEDQEENKEESSTDEKLPSDNGKQEESVKDEVIQRVVTPNFQKKAKEDGRMEEKKKPSFLEWLLSGDDIELTIPFLNISIHLTPLSASILSFTGVFILLTFLIFIGDMRMLWKYKKEKENYLCSKYK